MTTIYCSEKLANFFGKVGSLPTEKKNPKYGDWNGHLFYAGGKKCLIFINNKTAYTILMVNIRKHDILNFPSLFKETFIQQLDNDLTLTERQEIDIRRELVEFDICRTNNDKKIIGTINHHLEAIKLDFDRLESLETIDTVKLVEKYNDFILGTKLDAVEQKRGYFIPKEVMSELLK
jgi:hypothetical protein